MNQPMLFKFLCFAQSAKFFSHYGMRAVLILYMVQQLSFSDRDTFTTSAVFTALVELSGLFGGILADKYLGFKRSILWGGVILLIGYGAVFLSGALFFSLGLIVLGNSLFSSNLVAVLGSLYEENDPRRALGFTFFYMMQNLGAFFSTLLCGWLVIYFSFPIAFLFAASGMIVANLILFWKKSYLPLLNPLEKNGFFSLSICLALFCISFFVLQNAKSVFPFLPLIAGGFFFFFLQKLFRNGDFSKRVIGRLAVHLSALILFYGLGDQISSSLVVFGEREISRNFLEWTLPSSVIMSVNPLVILVFGSIVARVRASFILPFLLAAFSFAGLAALCFLPGNISIFSVMLFVGVLSLGELFVGPITASIASEIGAKGQAGTVMGMVSTSYCLAFLLGGFLSRMLSVVGEDLPLKVYGIGFWQMALFSLLGGGILSVIKIFFLHKKEVKNQKKTGKI